MAYGCWGLARGALRQKFEVKKHLHRLKKPAVQSIQVSKTPSSLLLSGFSALNLIESEEFPAILYVSTVLFIFYNFK